MDSLYARIAHRQRTHRTPGLSLRRMAGGEEEASAHMAQVPSRDGQWTADHPVQPSLETRRRSCDPHGSLCHSENDDGIGYEDLLRRCVTYRHRQARELTKYRQRGGTGKDRLLSTHGLSA